MKKRSIVLILCVLGTLMLTGCGCDHKYKTKIVTEATCSTTGLEKKYCTECGESSTREIPKSDQHDYISAVEKKASCNETGIKRYTCSVCEISYTEDIPMADHSFVEQVSTSASCEKSGEMVYQCKKCDYSYTKEIEPLGHSMTDATCTSPRKCKNCSYTEGESLGHNYVNKRCSRCDEREMMSKAELEAEMKKQPVYVESTKYIIQDERYKTLYPDMLSAVVYNNSDVKIKNLRIAFAAWDENNLPVKIVTQHDYSGGAYVVVADYDDANLVPGKTCGNGSGICLDDDYLNISTFKAVVFSYDDFNGNTWLNPLYVDWSLIYGNKELE